MSSDAAERLVAGRWTLHTALRRGPTGVIWRATDLATDQPLAVEVLELPPGMDDAEWARLWARIATEARTAAALGHPGLVGLHDLVAEPGAAYVATELVDALTLQELVARHGPLPVRRVAEVGLEVLDALEAVHRAGLVHLDLRPGNVLVAADGRARLAGAGQATLRTDPRLGLAADGAGGGGSTAFLAPEQARGDPAGPAADLWALGATLFLAVEGEIPFGGDGGGATRAAILDQRPRAAVLAGQLAPALNALLTKPAGGRPTVDEVRRLLEPFAGGHRPATAPPAATQATGLAAGSQTAGPGATASWARAEASSGGRAVPARRAARHEMDPVLRRVLLIAGGSALLALVSFGIAVAVIGDPLGLRSEARPTTVATAAPTTVATTTTVPPSSATATTVGAVVLPGWAVHTDPATGYQVAVPPGWRVVGDGGPRTELRDQASPTLLRIDWRQDPEADPMTTEQQASLANAGQRRDYRQARLEPTQFKGLPAALLEFTYQDGETWHSLELGMRAPRHHVAMAIHARDRDWGQGSALFEAFKASFVPPPA
jgi:eukaryotic-like serine/threonine-protein kinase